MFKIPIISQLLRYNYLGGISLNNLFRKSKSNVFKIITIISLIIIIGFTITYYTNSKYIAIRDSFYSEFNKLNFTEAKNIINSDNFYLKIKQKTLNKDLTTYFSSAVSKLCNNLLTNTISKEDALTILNEIKTYGLLNESLDKLIVSLDDNYTASSENDYNTLLELGIESKNNNNFVKAIELFNKIPSSSEYYNTAQTNISECAENYKEQLFTEADNLIKEDYYTKAIELLSNANSTIISADDEDIANKISSISDARDEYLLAVNSSDLASEDDQATSSMLQSISSQNINTLNIESLISNLIYVNLAEQITYVYEGYANNWNLVKDFSCSTGIDGEDTPTGVFTVLNRGDWFFSDSYGQGGKYWVQFLGDYLFHSLPYDESQSEILDYTLGTPASHGCVRLETEDAKWIYDNIEDGTKVIIS